MSSKPSPNCIDLPGSLAQALWRGDALGSSVHPVIPSGHLSLDAELPGGGWPCRNLTDILVAQDTQAEWRLLAPALAGVMRMGGSVLLIGTPCLPHLPGLAREGLRDDGLVYIDAPSLAERLWATEQALKASCFTAVLSWLPHARAGQIRRLQACAMRHPGPVFVLRPAESRTESSAAPLRVLLRIGPCPHPLLIEILKRRGPVLDKVLHVAQWPAGLAPLLPADRHAMPAVSPASPPAHTEPAKALALPAPFDSHVALDGLAARRLTAIAR